MVCCSSWNQFWLLVWKNWLLQKKRIPLTVVQIILPPAFAVIILVIRGLIKFQYISEPTVFPSFPVSGLNYSRLVSVRGGLWRIAYTPNTTLTAGIMNRAVKIMNMTTSPELAYNTEQELVDSLSTVSNVFGGIVFQLSNADATLPQNIVYKIRLRAEQYAGAFGSSNSSGQTGWLTDAMFPSLPAYGPREGNDTYGGKVPGYYYEGFLAIQRGIDLSIVQELNSSFEPESVETQLKRYPYPPYNDDKFIIILQTQLPFIILLSFIVIAPTICKDIVLEKEKKLKESMKLMGLRPWLHWMSWFFKFGIFMIISVILMTIIFHVKTKKGSIITFSAPSVTFVFLLLYVIALITFCFAISTFFSKASAGAAAGGILFIGSYVPYFFLSFRYNTLTLASKIGASIDFNLAMAFGCVKIAQYEGLGIGLQWSNVAKPVNVDDSHTMLHIFIMLIVDIVVYSIITWYFDALLPGDFGTPQPFYFPFTKWYWCGSSSSIDAGDFDDDFKSLVAEDKREYFEKPASNATPGIRIRGLTKQFKKKMKPAVSNMNIDMYEGNITALLGHNGAGKTTTMFMLTGFLPPSRGTAFVNGLDIRKDMIGIRRNLGLCPQHDVLFETMTVQEHLKFFAKLKGCPSSRVDEEVVEMIRVLHLEDKTDVQSKALSGGMKRKLCVGIALIADSKFVILDEPTSGMDPEARRQTWDILQSQQKGRTMILSTHFMDEADLLGDRIAIMADGQIQCYGTPMFLKNKYGIGYHMTIVKSPDCDVDNLVSVVKSQVPESMMESSVGAEVSFILPREQSSKFEGLFAKLETEQKHLGIDGFGASVTTMEEVFIKVGEAVDSSLEASLQNGHNGVSRDDQACLMTNGSYEQSNGATSKKNNGGKANTVFGVACEKVSGLSWYCLQFWAMFVKRIIHSWRNWLVTLVQLLVPVIFSIIACVVMITLPGTTDLPPLYLNMSYFTNPIIPYEIAGNSTGRPGISALMSCYAQTTANSGRQVYVNNNTDYTTMDDYLVKIANGSRDTYNRNYLIGGTAEVYNGSESNATLVGWFNNAAYHSIAISLSYVTNAILDCFGKSEYRIQTINHPLPWTLNSKVNNDIEDASFIGFIFSYNLVFGMSFLISTFVIFLVKERETGAKHLQFVSGVRAINFWLSTFAWDAINFLIPSVAIIIVIECFQVEGYTDENNSGYVLLDLIFYGWAIMPCVYVLSFLFQVASSGYVWLTVINLITGTATILTLYILDIPSLGVQEVGNVLEWVFYVIFPNFCFSKALQDLYMNFQNNRICNSIDVIVDRSKFCRYVTTVNLTNPCCPENCGSFCAATTDDLVSWKEPGIGRSLFFMAMQGVVYFVILAVIETDLMGRIRRACMSRRGGRVETMRAAEAEVEQDSEEGYHMGDARGVSKDSDVLDERDRVVNRPLDELLKTDSVLLRELSKVYGDFVAVSKLSVGIPYGQCFGLLGVNGAGKTTSFKMLTGDVKPTFGNAYVGGESVTDDVRKVQQQVGYCPQFDALIDQMTVTETLWMFACLRGVAGSCRKPVVEMLVDRLMLKDHAKKQVGSLSGGNKRKLSIAVALVGDPPIVFLDEPTTGMDPAARRLLWNTLTAVCNSGRTLILTSHSMEECEALCTRLAIMVNGVFQCLGSIQHLKAKFSEGYSLIMKIKGSETVDGEDLAAKVNRVKTFVDETFPGSFLKDYHEGLLNYQVETPNLTWSRIFGTIEAAKGKLDIEDYSVSQTTLEQLFISFARKQREPQDLETSCGRKCMNMLCCCCDC